MSIKTDELIDLSAVEAAIGRRILAIAYSVSDRIEFRGTKRCTKGLSCGDSCISKNKVCKKPLTRAQAAQHMALIGRVMGTVATKTQKPQGQKNIAAELLSALEVGDYEKAIELAEEIEAAAKQRAVDAVTQDPDRYGSYSATDDDLYNEGIRFGNGRPDDWILKELWAARGFDGLPQLTDASTIDAEIAAGSPSFYRGFGSTPERFDKQFEAIKSGDYYAGHGIYGHDTYAALVLGNDSDAIGESIAIAEKYGSGGGGIRGVLAKDAQIIEQSKITLEMESDFNRIRDWAMKKNEEIEFGVDSQTLARDAKASLASVEQEYSGRSRAGKRGILILTRSDGTEESFPDFEVENNAFAALFGPSWTFPGAPTNYKTKKDAVEAAAIFCKQKIAADRAASKYKGDPVGARVFRERASVLGRVILGDARDPLDLDFFNAGTEDIDFGGECSGRYATLKGYDAVYLDQAYESHYALTLNRSKYIIQEEPFFRR